MNNRLSLILIMLSVFSSVTLAVPKNIAVNNSQIQLGKLTITGTGFGSQTADVVMYDRFESDKAAQGDQIPFTSPEIGVWTDGDNRPSYNTIAHSGKFGANLRAGRFKLDFGKGIQEIFLSYWVRLPDGQIFPGGNWPTGKKPKTFSKDSSWKFVWLSDRDTGGNSSDICLPTHAGSGNFSLAGNDFILDTNIGEKETWWSWNSWMRISIWLRANPADPTLDGDLLFQTISAEKGVREYKNKTPIFDGDYANRSGEVYAGEPNIQQWQRIGFPGWMRSTSDAGTTPIYDDIYIAIGENSHARVEIADSSDYKNAKKVAIQKVKSWSDTNIEIDVIEGNFGENLKSAAFIFVWDKDGNRNTQGIPVQLYPKPPTSK